MAATDGSPLTAHGLPLSDANSGPSAVSRKPIADSDRGIEHYAFLQSLRNGERVYPRLVKHFRDADDRYNSGLFYFVEEKGCSELPDRGRSTSTSTREPGWSLVPSYPAPCIGQARRVGVSLTAMVNAVI